MVLHLDIKQQELHIYCYQAWIHNTFFVGGEDDYIRIVFYRLPKTDILEFTSVAESTEKREDIALAQFPPWIHA